MQMQLCTKNMKRQGMQADTTHASPRKHVHTGARQMGPSTQRGRPLLLSLPLSLLCVLLSLPLPPLSLPLPRSGLPPSVLLVSGSCTSSSTSNTCPTWPLPDDMPCEQSGAGSFCFLGFCCKDGRPPNTKATCYCNCQKLSRPQGAAAGTCQDDARLKGWESCTYGVAPGYTRSSATGTVTCNDGWLSSYPTFKQNCQAPTPPEGATPNTCTSALELAGTGGSCTLGVAAGYAHSGGGPLKVTCNDGALTELPSFTENACPSADITAQLSGHPERDAGSCPTTGSLPPGQGCAMECSSGYTCAASPCAPFTCSKGAWSGTPPTCLADCAPPQPPEGAAPGTCTRVLKGNADSCGLDTQAGYALVDGSLTIRCNDGVLTDSPTLLRYCLLLELPLGASAGTCPATLPGDGGNCTLAVASEFTLATGELQVTCTNGTLSELPTFHPHCPKPVPPLGATAGACTSTLPSGSSCALLVATGYSHDDGSLTMTCTAGTLSDYPTLSANPCSGASLLTYAGVGEGQAMGRAFGTCPPVGSELESGSNCTLACDTGHSCSSCGSDMACLAEEWRGSPPVCPAQCPQPTPPVGALQGSCTGVLDGFPTSCLLEVHPDYSLATGTLTLVCDDGSLSAAPTLKRQCEPPLLPTGAEPGSCTSRIAGNGGECTLDMAQGYTLADGAMRISCNNGTLSALPTLVADCAVPVAVGAWPGSCVRALNGSADQCRLSIADGYMLNPGPDLDISCVDGALSGLPTFRLCGAGSWCVGGLEAACAPGMFCPAGSYNQTQCTAGFFCSTPAQQQACPAGSFCPVRSTVPQACPARRYCPPGSAASMECPLGSFCPPSTGLPLPCALGSYCPAGSSSQDPCPVGNVCLSPSSVEECVGGEHCPAGTSERTPCASGSYCSSPDAAPVACPPGSVCPQSSVEPVPCQEGQYADVPGMSSCSVCARATLWLEPDVPCASCGSLGCDGSSQCLPGYVGDRCENCVDGFFHREGSVLIECLPCGATAPWVPVVLVLLVLVVAAVTAKLNSSRTFRQLVIPLTIGAVYVQLVSFLRVVQLWWPPDAQSALAVTSLLSLNLAALSEATCFVSFEASFWGVLAFPFLLALTLMVARGLYEYSSRSRNRLNAHRCSCTNLVLRAARALRIHTPAQCHQLMVQSLISFLSFGYMFLVWKSIMMFDCISIGDARRVRAFVELECGSHEWQQYLPGIVMGVLLYIVGIPVLFYWLAHSPYADRYLSSEVSCLRPQFRWWISAQLVWKVSMVLVLRLLLSHTVVQVVLCGLLLLLRLGAVLYLRPYATRLHNGEELALAVLALCVLVCGVTFMGAHASLSSASSTALLVLALSCLAVMVLLVVCCVVGVWRRVRAETRTLAEGDTGEEQIASGTGTELKPAAHEHTHTPNGDRSRHPHAAMISMVTLTDASQTSQREADDNSIHMPPASDAEGAGQGAAHAHAGSGVEGVPSDGVLVPSPLCQPLAPSRFIDDAYFDPLPGAFSPSHARPSPSPCPSPPSASSSPSPSPRVAPSVPPPPGPVSVSVDAALLLNPSAIYVHVEDGDGAAVHRAVPDRQLHPAQVEGRQRHASLLGAARVQARPGEQALGVPKRMPPPRGALSQIHAGEVSQPPSGEDRP